MGFTRYWEISSPLDANQFIKFSKDCKIICEEITKKFGHGIAGPDGENQPEFNDDYIKFNGIGDENSHEPFCISRESRGFNFCKTAAKPYDLHVQACLYLAGDYFIKNIKISSDSDGDDILSDIKTIIKKLKRDIKINDILNP